MVPKMMPVPSTTFAVCSNFCQKRNSHRINFIRFATRFIFQQFCFSFFFASSCYMGGGQGVEKKTLETRQILRCGVVRVLTSTCSDY